MKVLAPDDHQTATIADPGGIGLHRYLSISFRAGLPASHSKPCKRDPEDQNPRDCGEHVRETVAFNFPPGQQKAL